LPGPTNSVSSLRLARRASPRPVLLGLGLLAVLASLGALVAPVAATAASTASSATKVVRYHGYRLSVPARWPVYRLAAKRTTCVRFDRHAVYLGQPSADQRCPAEAAGRTEAILVAPLQSRAAAAGSDGGQALPLPSTTGAVPTRGSATQLVQAGDGVVVTATWGDSPSVIEHALRVRSLPRLSKGAAQPSAVAAVAHAVRSAKAATAPSQPGGVFTGEGFDACSTPSTSQMSAWGVSPYRAVGVYIGGTNMACSQSNLTSSWMVAQSAAGWHMIPIYVGLQAPGNDCGCAAISSASAASQGAAAARDAITKAQAIGLAPGNPLYFDMEGYTTTTSTSSTVLNFLAAWTSQLHASGYKSGVYSSAASGIRDLASEMGTGYAEPDDIWIANWNGAKNTSDSNVPSTDWSSHQRLHQYEGAHNETYDGDTINIDGDYVDAATAAAGAATTVTEEAAAPSLSVSPQASGAIDLRPSWAGSTGVSTWRIMGGPSPTLFAQAAKPVSVHARQPIVINSAYAYFEAQAIGSTGQVLGTSAPVATPAHLAVVGQSAFVPVHGKGGLPVQCFKPTTCALTTTVTDGKATLARTGPEQIPSGGGVVYFSLSSLAREAISRARDHHLAVKVAVRDVSGIGVTRTVNLIPFATSGVSPRHSVRQTALLRLIGTTDFVSNGWSGGILAACVSTTPCRATTTITVAGRKIASTRPQTLGVDELGYLPFVLTAAGHKAILLAHGNQLGARLTVKSTGTLVTSATPAGTGGGTTITGGGTALAPGTTTGAGAATTVTTATKTASGSIVLASFH
jgi:hypothetical protein